LGKARMLVPVCGGLGYRGDKGRANQADMISKLHFKAQK